MLFGILLPKPQTPNLSRAMAATFTGKTLQKMERTFSRKESQFTHPTPFVKGNKAIEVWGCLGQVGGPLPLRGDPEEEAGIFAPKCRFPKCQGVSGGSRDRFWSSDGVFLGKVFPPQIQTPNSKPQTKYKFPKPPDRRGSVSSRTFAILPGLINGLSPDLAG